VKSASYSLGERVAQLRDAKGWSQQDLADKSGIPRRTIQNLEYGEGSPRLDTLIEVCKALGTTLDALTGQPGHAKAQLADQVARLARLERNWAEAADLMAAVARAKPVRRLVGLYILTRDERYLAALRDMLPPQSPLLRWLDLAPSGS
jgi:transcriptional regulator with XRE-family HTH domain